MSEINFYSESLMQMRENYKKRPLNNIHLNRPAWLGSQDPMSEIYEKKSVLLQQGEIVYAHILQANTLLFRRFPLVDCPAQILYSTDPYFAAHPDILKNAAWGIYSYKGKPLDSVPDEWRDAIRVVTDEYDRSSFTFSVCLDQQTREYNMIPTMIYRKLLPKGKLCGSLLPVLTAPGCKQVLVLPKRYWTKNFTQAWVNGII